MSNAAPLQPAPAVIEIDDARLAKASEYIEEEEGATSRYRGWLGAFTATLLVAMSLFHLYAAVDIVTAQVLRPGVCGWASLNWPAPCGRRWTSKTKAMPAKP